MNIRLWWNMMRARLLAPFWYWKHKHFKCRAGYLCDWVYPYGLAPEAGCPLHDVDEKKVCARDKTANNIYLIIGYLQDGSEIIDCGMTENEARFSERVKQWIEKHPGSEMSVVMVDYQYLPNEFCSRHELK